MNLLYFRALRAGSRRLRNPRCDPNNFPISVFQIILNITTYQKLNRVNVLNQ